MRRLLFVLALLLALVLILACPQHVCADQSTRARTMAESSRGGWGSGRILTMTATAYTNSPSDTGKRNGDPGYGITKSGTVARVGALAAQESQAQDGETEPEEEPGGLIRGVAPWGGREMDLDLQCSMTFWWPLVADVNVPKPETVLLPIKDPDTLYGIFDGDEAAGESFKELADPARDVANTLGYPLFLRTDHVSGKHSYDRTCFVPSEEELPDHIFNVLEEHALALDLCGPPFKAIVLRRFIPLFHKFTAFWGDLPIAKERRYFVKDGRVECHHPYWPSEAIQFPRDIEPASWRDDLAELSIETVDEIALLTGYATKLAAVLPGHWSLDFALGQDGTWYFIDAARGERSWHPECNKAEGKPCAG